MAGALTGTAEDPENSAVWRGKSISVILPTYNEKDSIDQSIRGFCRNGVVDEILVVNNNAAPGTSEEVARHRGDVLEPCQGYGARSSAVCVRRPATTGDLRARRHLPGTGCL